MSSYSTFEIEEDDIVKLLPDEYEQVSGWVNVGVHAVHIELDDEGNLTVQAFARTNEGRLLGGLQVRKESSISEGGVDPDIDLDEPEIGVGDRFVSVIPFLDQDKNGEERWTPAGTSWEITSHNNNDVWNLVCYETGAWICPTEADLRDHEQFLPMFKEDDQ